MDETEVPEVTASPEAEQYDETYPEGSVDGTDGTESGTLEAPPEDPYAEFGGRDAVTKAAQIHQALQSQDGVMRLFFEAGRSMGLGLKDLEGLFGQASAANAPAAPEYDDDDVLTYRQVRELLQNQVLQPWQQSQAAQAEAVARSAVESARAELGVSDEGTWAAVLQLGDKYLGDDISPANVSQAVRKGHADFVNLVKANAQAYVSEKAAVKKSVPKAPAGGSTPAAAPDPEPKTVEEAIARARARLISS